MTRQEQKEIKESLAFGTEKACVFLKFKSLTLNASPTEVKTLKKYSIE